MKNGAAGQLCDRPTSHMEQQGAAVELSQAYAGQVEDCPGGKNIDYQRKSG